MRETRSSGLEGGVEFKSPSLPLFYRNRDAQYFPFVFRPPIPLNVHEGSARVTTGWAGEKQKEKGKRSSFL